jgi:hypothetical protein
MPRTYNPDSVARALEHHRAQGRIRAWSRSADARHVGTRFVVTLSNGTTTDPLTLTNAYALALGLTSAEQAPAHAQQQPLPGENDARTAQHGN